VDGTLIAYEFLRVPSLRSAPGQLADVICRLYLEHGAFDCCLVGMEIKIGAFLRPKWFYALVRHGERKDMCSSTCSGVDRNPCLYLRLLNSYEMLYRNTICRLVTLPPVVHGV